MGNKLSLPVPPSPSLGAFCLILSPWTKIRLLHAPPEVEALVLRVANNINTLRHGFHDMPTPHKDKLGSTQITMACNLFTTVRQDKEAAILGKLLCVELLQELHKLGWDLDLSCRLARYHCNASVLFFRKVSTERPGAWVVCVATAKTSWVSLLNHDQRVRDKVLEAIRESWTEGIQEEREFGLKEHGIKMCGKPWDTDKHSTDDSGVICRLVNKLREINLTLLAGINIDGSRDALFFIQETSKQSLIAKFPQKEEFCVISFVQGNILRMVGCTEMFATVRQVVEGDQYIIELVRGAEGGQGLREVVVQGKPWRCAGPQAVRTRQLVCRVGEAMLRAGWLCTSAINNSRRKDNKSMLLYRRGPPGNARFSCISPASSDLLYLIDFPPSDQGLLNRAITSHYPKLAEDLPSEPRCLTFRLEGCPWGQTGGSELGWALHARSMLLHLLLACRDLGYMVAGAADLSSKWMSDENGDPEYALDVDTIYLFREEGGRSSM